MAAAPTSAGATKQFGMQVDADDTATILSAVCNIQKIEGRINNGVAGWGGTMTSYYLDGSDWLLIHVHQIPSGSVVP